MTWGWHWEECLWEAEAIQQPVWFMMGSWKQQDKKGMYLWCVWTLGSLNCQPFKRPTNQWVAQPTNKKLLRLSATASSNVLFIMLYSKSYSFSSSHVQMSELDHKGGWHSRIEVFLTLLLEKTFESPLDSEEIKPVNPKGNQPWIFIGRTDVEAEAPIIPFGYLMRRTVCLEKTLMLGKYEGRGRGDRGWDGWMASLIQWMWVWANSERQSRTGKPGVLQLMGLQRVRHDLETEQC